MRWNALVKMVGIVFILFGRASAVEYFHDFNGGMDLSSWTLSGNVLTNDCLSFQTQPGYVVTNYDLPDSLTYYPMNIKGLQDEQFVGFSQWVTNNDPKVAYTTLDKTTNGQWVAIHNQTGQDFPFNGRFYTGDFDGDGADDWCIFRTNSVSEVFTTLGLSCRNGQFRTGHYFPGWNYSPDAQYLVEDFTGDGRTDIAVIQESSTTNKLTLNLLVSEGGLDNKFYPKTYTTSWGYNVVRKMYVADLNGDHLNDIFFTWPKDGEITICSMFSGGFGDFSFDSFDTSLDHPGSDTNALVADLNADGCDDIVFVDVDGETNTRLLTAISEGGTSFATTNILTSWGTALRNYRITDLDRDGADDIYFLWPRSNQVAVAVAVSDQAGGFNRTGYHSSVPWPDDDVILYDDFNGDHLEDAVFVYRNPTNSAKVTLCALTGSGTGSFFQEVPKETGWGYDSNRVYFAGNTTLAGSADIFFTYNSGDTLAHACSLPAAGVELTGSSTAAVLSRSLSLSDEIYELSFDVLIDDFGDNYWPLYFYVKSGTRYAGAVLKDNGISVRIDGAWTMQTSADAILEEGAEYNIKLMTVTNYTSLYVNNKRVVTFENTSDSGLEEVAFRTKSNAVTFVKNVVFREALPANSGWSFSDPAQQKLTSVLPESFISPDYSAGTFSVITNITHADALAEPGGVPDPLRNNTYTWGLMLPEAPVFKTLLRADVQDSLEDMCVRISKGGSIYSYDVAGLGETVSPQYGSDSYSLYYPWGINYTPWVDEVWMPVINLKERQWDLYTAADTNVYEYHTDVHAAGLYCRTNIDTSIEYARKGDEDLIDYVEEHDSTFYNPILADYRASTAGEKSYSIINWMQCAHIEGGFFENEALSFNRYRLLGDGVLECTAGIYNYSDYIVDAMTSPWGGVRITSLGTNVVISVSGERTVYSMIKYWNGAAWVGEMSLVPVDSTLGYMIFCNEDDSDEPAMAIVFGGDKYFEDSNFDSGDRTYSSVRAVSTARADQIEAHLTKYPNAWKNKVMFSKRNEYDLRKYDGSYFRYFLLTGTISEIESKIASMDLVEKASFGYMNYVQGRDEQISWYLDANNNITSTVQSEQKPYITTYVNPIRGSRPVFLLKDNIYDRIIVSTDPYLLCMEHSDQQTYYDAVVSGRTFHKARRPFDGTTEYLGFLGYTLDSGW